MEVYVDDMLAKSQKADDHIQHLEEIFQVLRRYRMRLNPLSVPLEWPQENSWDIW